MDAVGVQAPVEPEHCESRREAQGVLRARRHQPLERCAEVLVIGREPLEPDVLGRAGQLGLGAPAELEEVLCVPPASSSSSPESLELLEGVLADRLEHPEARSPLRIRLLSASDFERVQVGLADLLGRLERAAAREDGEAREETLSAASSRS